MEKIQSSIQPNLLSLNPTEEIIKVSNPNPVQRKFKQAIRYFGHRIQLMTGPLPSSEVQILKNHYGEFVIIPVNSYLRRQHDTIEEFAMLYMDIPPSLSEEWKARDDKDTPYKKIWDGDRLYLSVSNWCSYYKQDGSQINPIKREELGEGTWDVGFIVSGLYYGYHKDNKIASISMYAQSIQYIPKSLDSNTILEEILNEVGAKSKPEKNVTIKRKRKKETQ